MKVNYDEAAFRETNEAGLGAVIRDSAGRVITSLAKRIPLPQTMSDVEAAVAKQALLLVKDLRLSSIILKGDSEIVTRALQDIEQSLASFGNLVEESKLLVDSFLSCNVFYVKRKRNSVAHNLTRYAKHVSGLVV
ncbi:uncharacterized protein LOC142644519 [Castanea sativa]|uniref:uncharacterized protein LOC142644519 n=1 Tax=Castanea sativa TaxID=21020 RepID=UPI003F64A771